jgi:hypothetical protein
MTSFQKLLRVATVLGFALVGATVLWPSRALAENAPVTLPIETVANYIHAVIEADRDVYTRHGRRALANKGCGRGIGELGAEEYAAPTGSVPDGVRAVHRQERPGQSNIA